MPRKEEQRLAAAQRAHRRHAAWGVGAGEPTRQAWTERREDEEEGRKRMEEEEEEEEARKR